MWKFEVEKFEFMLFWWMQKKVIQEMQILYFLRCKITSFIEKQNEKSENLK